MLTLPFREFATRLLSSTVKKQEMQETIAIKMKGVPLILFWFLRHPFVCKHWMDLFTPRNSKNSINSYQKLDFSETTHFEVMVSNNFRSSCIFLPNNVFILSFPLVNRTDLCRLSYKIINDGFWLIVDLF